MPPPKNTPKVETEPQPEEQARPKFRSRRDRKRFADKKAQEEMDRSKHVEWNQAFTGLESRNDWTPTEEVESPSKSSSEPNQNQEPRRLDLEQNTPNPLGIATPLNEGLTERFCREEAFQGEGEEQEAPPQPQEAASGSGGLHPDTQVPQETPLGKHRRKGDKPDTKAEMETEPPGRDLGKEAEEEAGAAAAAQNAANCAAAANEASRVANEVLRATQIPTPATPNPTQTGTPATTQEHLTQSEF